MGRTNLKQRADRSDAAIAHWMEEVSRAALPFESRWTWLTLRRVDPELGRALHEQLGLFNHACLEGTPTDVELQGAATVRGYAAAIRKLADASAPDDAYSLGHDPKTGCKVAVGNQRACLQRVREIHGQDVIWVTPDEVAVMLGSIESMKTIAAVKQMFPGAEVIRRYEDEGCSDVDA
jgi:hypothetical protein